MGAAQLAMIRRADHHCIVQQILIVQLLEYRGNLAVAVPDAVQIIILKALPAVVLARESGPIGGELP